MDHHCQIANKCIGIFNKRLYLLFVSSVLVLSLLNMVGLLCGQHFNEIVWLGVLLNGLTTVYVG